MSMALVLAAGWLLALPPGGWPLRRLRPGEAAVPSVAPGETGPFAEAAAYDLFAVCLRSGLSIAGAAAAVAAALPGELAASLGRVADLLVLGTDAGTAWRQAAERGFVELAALVRRTASSGAAFADGLAELAQQRRDSANDDALAHAEQAGVRISGPLGLCFLPAFVCLGIVPVVIGLASSVLGQM
ncbi:type II secretion system F family protein [Gordonia crocea]|uniref:Type II secretion system protein F n=1 Tax=Gordonia crocea TaxID=589162 RepID=A0A7M3SV87_9ACTN|nr:type II secretion system F family protein [Gordonia crocea]GED96561.1 type II secretion system protein F [Gordonia crocea]